MICPQSYLETALQEADPALISQGAKKAMRRFAAALPDAASGHIIECRLAEAGGVCDYSIVLSRGDGGFAGFLQGIDTDPFWADAQTVLNATQSALAKAGLVWLEFDFGTGEPARPCFFVSQGPQATAQQDGLALGEALLTAFDLPVLSDFRHLVRLFPDAVRLKQSGIMAGRGVRGMRLVLDGVTVAGLTTFLRSLDWPGDMNRAAELERIATRIAPDGGCRVDLDLGAGLGQTLGVELLYPDLPVSETVADVLRAEGLCSPETELGLKRMMQRRRLVRAAGNNATHRLDFGLNHLKLSAPPTTHVLEAKAYFSLLNLPDFQGISV